MNTHNNSQKVSWDKELGGNGDFIRDILDRSSYGVNIYAYILRQSYKDQTVLVKDGKGYMPTHNPYNNHRQTLLIEVINGIATHKDIDGAIEAGNVFDFAAIYFGLTGRKLLQKINEVLRLRIETDQTEPPQFSYFRQPIRNTNPLKTVNLIDVYSTIKGTDFVDQTDTLRTIEDHKKARAFKASKFDYTTFSGTFTKRGDKYLIEHSGLLTIDFDHVPDVSGLKSQLLADEYFETELMFVSPSSDGLKWIIPIDLNDTSHQEYFEAVSCYVSNTYGIGVDQSGKDVSRACFLAHDPNVFINQKYL